MSRLIDADKVIFKFPRLLTEKERETFGYVCKKAFEDAPTVEAIPVEWLEDIIEDWKDEARKREEATIKGTPTDEKIKALEEVNNQQWMIITELTKKVKAIEEKIEGYVFE